MGRTIVFMSYYKAFMGISKPRRGIRAKENAPDFVASGAFFYS